MLGLQAWANILILLLKYVFWRFFMLARQTYDQLSHFWSLYLFFESESLQLSLA